MIPVPKPTRLVGIHQHVGVLDFYIASGANVTFAELRAHAEEFGNVMDEGRYLRLFVDPTFDPREVLAYFEALYPAYNAEMEAEVAEAGE